MDGAQVLAQQPHGRIEPLEGGEQVDEDDVAGVPETDMSTFMSENGSVMCFVVAAVHHDIVHPTEWRHLSVTGHAENGTIRQGMLLASSYQQHDFQY